MSDTVNETIVTTIGTPETIGDFSGNPSGEKDYIPAFEFNDGRNSQFLHIIGI
jgi:hypothetical protein